MQEYIDFWPVAFRTKAKSSGGKDCKGIIVCESSFSKPNFENNKQYCTTAVAL